MGVPKRMEEEGLLRRQGAMDVSAAGEQQGLAAQGGREAAAHHRAQTRRGQRGAVVGVVLRRTVEEYGRGRIFHG